MNLSGQLLNNLQVRKTLSGLIVFGLLLVPTQILNAASVKAGTSCTKLGQSQVVNGYKYTCIKYGKKLIWGNSVLIPNTSADSWSLNTTRDQIISTAQQNLNNWLKAQKISSFKGKMYIEDNDIIELMLANRRVKILPRNKISFTAFDAQCKTYGLDNPFKLDESGDDIEWAMPVEYKNLNIKKNVMI